MAQPFTTPESPEAETSDPFEGTPYRLIRRLARGGMGQVYLIEHRELGRECVAKLIHERLASEQQLLERIRIEAESLGTLNHPNIVSVNNFGTTQDGRPFIVMEYLRGRDLARTLASGRSFSVIESIDIILQACSALGAAHSIGVIHRDIKPENLFLHEESDGSTVLKILDFGVARIIPGVSPDTPTPLPQPTATGVIVGTLRYASPEGVSGQRVDYRADIYSLGLVLYRLLTGRNPFGDHLSDTGIITATLTEAPAAPSSVATQYIPSELDEIVLKALQKSPEERYATMKDFKVALSYVRDTLAADEHFSEEIVLPLNRELAQDMSSCTSTVAAVRTSVERRKATLNAILFATVLLVTTVLVGIFVAKLRQSTGAP
jgi:serine/threonine-protein kinase